MTSEEEFERKVKEIFERTKNMLDGFEKGKRNAIINAALELERLGIPPEEVGALIVEYLGDKVSKGYVYDCIDKKYKGKRREKKEGHQQPIKSDSGLIDAREEKKEAPITIDTEGNPILEEEEEDRRSEAHVKDEVEASLKVEKVSETVRVTEQEKPEWHNWDKDEKDRLIEAARADTESIRKHRDKIQDELRELKENTLENETRKSNELIRQLELERQQRFKFQKESEELKEALATKTAFKAASEITPHEDLVSENKALKIENEILKKREPQITFENEPLELVIPEFYEDLLVLTLPKNRGKAAKIIHDGKRVTAIALWKKEVKS